MEVYKDYTFFSMRLMREDTDAKEGGEDVDFNILLFHDKIITIHSREWTSITGAQVFINISLLVFKGSIGKTPSIQFD
jgi:hypothetical protein